jgi:uncharacterized protein YcsI (UPF0317 family)
MSRESHPAPDAIDVREGQAFDATAPTWGLCRGSFEMAVVLQQIHVRHHRGQTSDPRFANLAVAAAGLLELPAARRP